MVPIFNRWANSVDIAHASETKIQIVGKCSPKANCIYHIYSLVRRARLDVSLLMGQEQKKMFAMDNGDPKHQPHHIIVAFYLTNTLRSCLCKSPLRESETETNNVSA